MKTLPDPSSTSHSVDELPAPQFAIAVSATLQERRTRTLKHGDTFAVFDHRGDIGGEPGNSEGLYHRDTRMLSQFQLLLEEARPLLLSSMTQDDNAVFSADLSNPDLLVDGQDRVAPREHSRQSHQVHLDRRAATSGCWCATSSDRPLQLRLTFRFASDFADLFEVRGERRAARGESSAALRERSQRRARATWVSTTSSASPKWLSIPAPKTLTTARAAFELMLKPHETRRIFVRCGVPSGADGDWSGRLFYRRMRAARHALRESSERAASIDSSNSVFNEIVRRSVSDLYMLMTDTPQGPYPYAGTPWFSTPFGRDGIITALMTLWLDPTIAKGVLRFLARHAGHRGRAGARRRARQDLARDAPWRDGESARGAVRTLLRQRRCDAAVRAAARRVLRPHRRSRDGALAVAECARGAGMDRSLRGSRRRRLRRILPPDQGRPRKSGMEGFVRRDLSQRRPPRGGSDRAVRSASLCVRRQAARRRAGGGARAHARADALAAQAEALRQNFEAKFWCEELSVYALALDGAKEPCRVVSSNTGQVLFTGIAVGRARAARRAHVAVARHRSAVGASAPSPSRRRATTPCRTTTARCGRTTTA